MVLSGSNEISTVKKDKNSQLLEYYFHLNLNGILDLICRVILN